MLTDEERSRVALGFIKELYDAHDATAGLPPRFYQGNRDGSFTGMGSTITNPLQDFVLANTNPSTQGMISVGPDGSFDTWGIPAGEFSISTYGNAQTNVSSLSRVTAVSLNPSQDSYDDAVAVNSKGLTILLNSGNGDASYAFWASAGAGNTTVAIANGDFDADGSLDIAVAAQGDNAVSILFSTGDGNLTPFVQYPAGGT